MAHFVRKFAERQRKVIDHIPDDLVEALKQRPWPGNIRELQNVIGLSKELPKRDTRRSETARVASISRHVAG